ncbi:ABC transporter substrate-binding protein [Salicibibacter cibarius]|uniref:ABC transporter substrate-binding protein n=1 Tax=Salicibibacter cibarius TaxID=2743000 RepID=A0A7T6Z007_9BACI|nr:ABC transporter substrate-binding protein [Salicibibacter cibarius]QQK74440.1 ABC transporter substrate-binding protein [Salicibibacter cibarius]
MEGYKSNIFISPIFVILLLLGIGTGCTSSDNSTPTNTSSEPVEINIGHGISTEEPLYLVEHLPEVASNLGESYTLNMSSFQANADRINAYQAGEIDGGTLGQGAALMISEQGVDLTVLASVVQDSVEEGYNHKFLTMADSELEYTAEALEGAVIGIPDYMSPTDLWGRAAVRDLGLDPDSDVEWVNIAAPAMTASLEAGIIDIGMFAQPFFEMTQNNNEEYEEVFNSKTGVPINEDFLVLFMDPEFISENEEAVEDFLADYVAVTEYYLDNQEEMRQLLLDVGAVEADPEDYIEMEDSDRSKTGEINLESWKEVQNLILEEEWIEDRVNLESIVDMSYLPDR